MRRSRRTKNDEDDRTRRTNCKERLKGHRDRFRKEKGEGWRKKERVSSDVSK